MEVEGFAGHVCSCTVVWLCIAMHGGRRLSWSCMLTYSYVWLYIAMHGGRRLGWLSMLMYSFW